MRRQLSPATLPPAWLFAVRGPAAQPNTRRPFETVRASIAAWSLMLLLQRRMFSASFTRLWYVNRFRNVFALIKCFRTLKVASRSILSSVCSGATSSRRWRRTTSPFATNSPSTPRSTTFLRGLYRTWRHRRPAILWPPLVALLHRPLSPLSRSWAWCRKAGCTTTKCAPRFSLSPRRRPSVTL